MVEVIVKPPTSPSNVQVNAPAGELLEPHLISFFQLNPTEINENDKRMMGEISGYLKGKTSLEAIDELRNIRFRLGTPQLGVSPLAHLHRYIKLRNAALENEKMAEAMET